jgi:hypothetical protein
MSTARRGCTMGVQNRIAHRLQLFHDLRHPFVVVSASVNHHAATAAAAAAHATTATTAHAATAATVDATIAVATGDTG